MSESFRGWDVGAVHSVLSHNLEITLCESRMKVWMRLWIACLVKERSTDTFLNDQILFNGE